MTQGACRIWAERILRRAVVTGCEKYHHVSFVSQTAGDRDRVIRIEIATAERSVRVGYDPDVVVILIRESPFPSSERIDYENAGTEPGTYELYARSDARIEASRAEPCSPDDTSTMRTVPDRFVSVLKILNCHSLV